MLEVDHLGKSLRFRLNLLLTFCFLITCGILVRAAYLQVLSNPRLERLAKRQFQFQTLVRPRRGAIFDRNHHPLAISVQSRSLAANPQKITHKKVVASRLASILGSTSPRLLKRLSEKKQFVWIKRHLTTLELKQMQKAQLLDAEGNWIQGLWLVEESDRVYPQGKLAGHILGTVGIDNQGIEGVELWKEEVLRGQVASVHAIKDALGRPTFMDAHAAQGLKDGDPILLSLDAALQFEVEHHLKVAVDQAQAQSGTALVMDASTGEILALANEPSFNPNDLQQGSLDRHRNRALTDGYEPGSTLKALLVVAALRNGWKMTDRVWGEKGSFVVQGHRISEAMAHEKFEWLSLEKMLQVSSNVGAAKIAMKLGPSAYFETLRLVGFGQKTGSGFPGEIAGRFPTKAPWEKDFSSLTTANVGFGQGILVTPLQIVRSFATIRNGGYLVQPTFFKGASFPPTRVFSEEISRQVMLALESVTQEGGTGKSARLAGFRVAGKTGTAQMVDPVTKKYSRKKYIASFVGFPLDVNPPLVIFTSLVEPRGAYYGSMIAAPLFRDILASAATRLGLPTQPSETFATPPPMVTQSGTLIPKEEEALGFQWQKEVGKDKAGWIIPALQGLSAQEVLELSLKASIPLSIKGSGVVIEQSPQAGQKMKPGATLLVTLGDP